MADIKVYLNKFSAGGGRVFARALEEARRREQNYVMAEHLIAAFAELEATSFAAVLQELQVERAAFQAVLEERLAAGPRYTGRGVRLAPQTIEVCKLACKRAESWGRTQIEPVDLLVALALNRPAHLFAVLGPLGVTPSALLIAVLDIETAVVVAWVSTRAGAHLLGKSVRLLSGPFASFTGYIANVQPDGSKLEIGVDIFGRRTFVDVPMRDIELLDFTRPSDH